MIDAMITAVALALPTDATNDGRGNSHSGQRHHAQPSRRHTTNRWRDSGVPRVWDGVPEWIRDLGFCIRKHESIDAGHYKARNGSGSSAAGAYQFLQGTWTGNARYTPVARPWAYGSAASAPDWAQDAVFIHAIKHGGIKAWHGTFCPGT